eukprot:15045749-Alexandrium_andersonii.AAC.1
MQHVQHSGLRCARALCARAPLYTALRASIHVHRMQEPPSSLMADGIVGTPSPHRCWADPSTEWGSGEAD